MSNMSYCRFKNTLEDFRVCAKVYEELFNSDEVLSADELRVAQLLAVEVLELAKILKEQCGTECIDEAITDIEEEIASTNAQNKADEKN